MTTPQSFLGGEEGRLEELRTNARLLALIYDNTSDPVYLVRVTPGGRYVFVCNLLSNAIKFGLGKPIEVAVSKFDGRARLAVHDHGIGIEASALERIFEPFVRNVSVRHYGGLGLGLYIVKTLVSAMKGVVRVESTPGAGATFIVELPLRITPEVADARPHRG